MAGCWEFFFFFLGATISFMEEQLHCFELLWKLLSLMFE